MELGEGIIGSLDPESEKADLDVGELLSGGDDASVDSSTVCDSVIGSKHVKRYDHRITLRGVIDPQNTSADDVVNIILKLADPESCVTTGFRVSADISADGLRLEADERLGGESAGVAAD
jgi:hypothetical protein